MSQERIAGEGFRGYLEKMVRKIEEERKELLWSLRIKEKEIEALKEETAQRENELTGLVEKKESEKGQIQKESDIKIEQEKKKWQMRINQNTATLSNMENKFIIKEKEIRQQMIKCEKELADLEDRFIHQERASNREIRVRDVEIQNLKMEVIKLKARLNSEYQQREKDKEDVKNEAVNLALKELEKSLFADKEEFKKTAEAE